MAVPKKTLYTVQSHPCGVLSIVHRHLCCRFPYSSFPPFFSVHTHVHIPPIISCKAILFCIMWKAVFLFLSIQNVILSAKKQIACFTSSFVLPSVLCLISFLREDVDPRHSRFNLHLARSSVFCRMCLPSHEEEFVLLYFPMTLAMAVVIITLAAVLKNVVSAYVRMATGVAARNLFRENPIRALRCACNAIVARPHICYVALLCLAISAQCLWLISVTVTVTPLLESFQKDSFNWIKCIRYSARLSLSLYFGLTKRV